MVTKEQLCEDLKNILRKYTGSDVDDLTPVSKNTLSSLQIDSVDRMCILYDLSREYNNALTDDDVFEFEDSLTNVNFEQLLLELCEIINKNLR